MKKAIDKGAVLIGSDFEMFLQNEDGRVISAIPFNNGTKHEPQKLNRDGCCIQRDGVLQECNVPPVRLDQADLFAENVKYVKEFIMDLFARKAKLKLVCCPSAEVEDEELLDPEAMQMGCDPDYNAWEDGDVNQKADSFQGGLRSCGAHIHFSYPDADVETSMDLMKLFDVFLTVPFLLIDTDERRRQLYGKAGAFRVQIWENASGFEARTLSNFWISDEKYIKYVFEQLNKMFDYYNKKGVKEVIKDKDLIVSTINNSDTEAAEYLCEKYGIKMIKQTQMA